MLFEWDENKRLRNIEEHGVDFKVAVRIFIKPVLENIDDRNDYGEIRIRALGVTDDECFMVIYTWRKDTRRIISAWKVGQNGKRKYEAILARSN